MDTNEQKEKNISRNSSYPLLRKKNNLINN